ncbi:biogenesis of lysosome-related organelles complex 1 subunit 4 [Lepeophtheirus salmonis]|uniref:Biogenesis of lysosomal organelles complex1, subunit 4, cappuccino [Rattus norvegicus] n=1 Tax=Lepeophtheirus salmonis TaxID=72036 RepID=A0A0K2U2Q0_LEPSM|nr:biogenesis of lysosome-related organelles complex 1 subunit 4-like [Lepeophtheirus salmonis]
MNNSKNMNGSSEDLLRGTVNAYSNYLDASGSGSKGWGVSGSQSQFNVIEDGIEDLEIKITEFERLMDLLESESNLYFQHNFTDMRSKYKDLEKVFDRIDRLDVMVSIVREDLQRTDKQLAQAESTIEGGLRSFVPAFISSKFTVQEPTSPTETVYEEPPKLFSTEDFFKD